MFNKRRVNTCIPNSKRKDPDNIRSFSRNSSSSINVVVYITGSVFSNAYKMLLVFLQVCFYIPGILSERRSSVLAQCSVCLKHMSSRTNLRKHMEIHTGQRNYQCDVCNKKFRRKHHLNRHKKAIHKINP